MPNRESGFPVDGVSVFRSTFGYSLTALSKVIHKPADLSS
jgi:hypothetical protein